MFKLDRQFGLYVIREPLALGSSKASCKAEDPFFDRNVVLKLVGPEAVNGLENLQRLVPFLDSVASLEHPAISPFYDSGIEGGACYYTSPFYTGGSLADQLTSPMNIGKGMRIILQLCSGLAYAYNEGFEHGKLSLQNIFFTEGGHAVITDFGVSAAIKKLKQKKAASYDFPQKRLRAETLQSVGEILIKLLLGTGAKPDAVSTSLLRQTHSAPIANLAADLLSQTEHEINGFDELIERLTDLAILGSEVGINEYVEYVEQTNTPHMGMHIPSLKPALTPSQRQLEIKESVYAKDEIRRLVAEKSKLQEILSRAAVYKKHAEKKLEAGSAALKLAEKSKAKTLSDAKIAFDQTIGNNKTHLHPTFWLAGGILVGSLMTGGFAYLKQPTQQIQRQEKTTQIKTTELQIPRQEVVTKVNLQASSALAETPIPVVEKSPQENLHLWWPAGSEFDPTAAVAVSESVQVQVNHPDPLTFAQESARLDPSHLSNQEPTPGADVSGLSQTDNRAQAEEQRWWSFGQECSPDLSHPVNQLNHDEDLQEVMSIIENWAQAWSNKDSNRYFSFYSKEYRPEPGHSKEEWRSIRLARLTRPQWIKIMLEDFKVRSVAENHIQVKLKQNYSSNYYQDQILKSLNLVKENGQWRIVTERSLGTVNDMIGG